MEKSAAVLGFVVSLLFSVVPGLKDWYQVQVGANGKRVLMAGALSLVAVGLFLSTCLGSPAEGMTCSSDGLAELLFGFFVMATSNQATFMLTPKRDGQPKAEEATVAKATRLAVVIGVSLFVVSAAVALGTLLWAVPVA